MTYNFFLHRGKLFSSKCNVFDDRLNFSMKILKETYNQHILNNVKQNQVQRNQSKCIHAFVSFMLNYGRSNKLHDFSFPNFEFTLHLKPLNKIRYDFFFNYFWEWDLMNELQSCKQARRRNEFKM